MFTKTLMALFTVIVLTTSYVSAVQAQTNGRGCVSSSNEEGVLSAHPAWNVCR
ncbi:MAG TPA: hypothetical protein VM867_03345 [Xanthobacteraceae bacterium]|jgi:hypothetical protein|nr:hypothetical protein [Xanthobacteraceae bacterium]